MSDYASSLPVRTEQDGDVVVKVSDGTVPSQHLGIDAAGKVTVKLDDGAGNAVTSQTNGAQRALDVGINVAGVQIDPRQIRTLTSADNVTIANGAGAAAVNIQDGGNSITVDGTVSASNFPSTVDTNYGAVGASTIRTASEIGNATGAANFGNGATGAQTLRVAANIAVAGADVSSTNPVPVTISSTVGGTSIQDYNKGTAIAAAATSTHDYTVSAAKTLNFARAWAAASGKMKIEVQYETAAASGVFTSKFVGFNSTATPTIDITVVSVFPQVTGAKIRIIRTNLDNQAQDLYSTIEGTEV